MISLLHPSESQHTLVYQQCSHWADTVNAISRNSHRCQKQTYPLSFLLLLLGLSLRPHFSVSPLRHSRSRWFTASLLGSVSLVLSSCFSHTIAACLNSDQYLNIHLFQSCITEQCQYKSLRHGLLSQPACQPECCFSIWVIFAGLWLCNSLCSSSSKGGRVQQQLRQHCLLCS